MWLRNRKQYVQVGEAKSRIANCSSGVAQGSLTGPQLFCVLLSFALKKLPIDVAEKIGLKMLCFADDTRFLFQSQNLEQSNLVQKYVNSFVNAVSEVGLKINASKSIVVYYGRDNFVRDITIDGVVVPVNSHSLELGCILSNTMNFHLQLDRNILKANRFIFMIRNSFSVRTYAVLEKLYLVYFCPLLLYSSQIWLTDFQYMKLALYRIFRKFWRLGGGYIKPKKDILDPFQMALKQNFSFMFQLYNGKMCLDFNDFFQAKTGDTTRSQVKRELIVQRNRYVNRDHFFTTEMAKRYNALPENVKQSNTVLEFKRKIHNYLKETEPTPYCNFIPWYKRK